MHKLRRNNRWLREQLMHLVVPLWFVLITSVWIYIIYTYALTNPQFWSPGKMNPQHLLAEVDRKPPPHL